MLNFITAICFCRFNLSIFDDYGDVRGMFFPPMPTIYVPNMSKLFLEFDYGIRS